MRLLDGITDSMDIWASLVAQRLKRLPLIQETWVRSLGREDNKQKSLQIGRRKYDLLTNIVT